MGQRGQLFIISAPSGAGKTSLVKALLESLDCIDVSVSHTTRQKRKGEIDGADYFFVDKAAFERSVEEHAFLEYAEVFDHYYGTSKATVEQCLSKGHDVILEIDWQGAQQVRRSMPESRSIFILPPSRAELENRLRGRGQDSDDVIARRMSDAVNEISHHHEYQYQVVNDQFDDALNELINIILAFRRNEPEMAKQYPQLIEQLLN